jgi:hypothetical protein
MAYNWLITDSYPEVEYFQAKSLSLAYWTLWRQIYSESQMWVNGKLLATTDFLLLCIFITMKMKNRPINN